MQDGAIESAIDGEKRVQSAAAAAASGAGSLEAQTMLFSRRRTAIQCCREASSLEAETAFSNGFFLPTYLSVAFAQPIILLIFTWNQDAWLNNGKDTYFF